MLHPEAAFLAGYAAALVAMAAWLVAMGRRSTDLWSSKVLAASRPTTEQPDEQASWLHIDVPTFHLVMSGVALAAALVLTAVNAVRHHHPIEIAVQLALLTVISVGAYRLRRMARSATRENAAPAD